MSRDCSKVVVACMLAVSFCASAFSAELAQVTTATQISQDVHLDENRTLLIDGKSEDEWIVEALWLDDNERFAKSRAIYAKLYEATDKKEYLFREVSSSIYSKTYIPQSLERLKEWSSKNPKNLIGKRLLMALYIDEKYFNEAKEVGMYLINNSDNISDLELAANPYLYLGEYSEALKLLNKLYSQTHDDDLAIKIATIENQYLKHPKKAIQILETHRMIIDSSADVYQMLIELYAREKNLPRILETYQALYTKYPQKEYLDKIIEIFLYNRQFKQLISYLEEIGEEKALLYDLYKKEQYFNKAKVLSEEFYALDKDPKWLAEKAILIYEEATSKNDKKILQEVTSLFEKAIVLGVKDSLYLNYYGYTLIDQNIDIDKGLKIIENTLKEQPNNVFYLDSQAWGYYKKKDCLKAYEIMKKVIESEGLDEDEIKEHWEKIQSCQKPVLVGSIKR